MRFYKKDDAINYYNKLKNKDNYKLIQEDTDLAGSKCFHVIKLEDLWKLIENEENPNYYEFWTEDTNLLFSIDLDYKDIKNEINSDIILKKVILKVIEGAKKYYKHEYKIEDIIILENQYIYDNKYSAHIIFLGLNFANFLVCKDFYMKLDKDFEINKDYVDKSIYNKTCLRLYGSSKMGKHNTLISKKLTIDDKNTKYDKNNYKNKFDFFKESLITNISEKNKIISDIKYKNNKEYKKYKNNGINIEEILDKLPNKYCDEYDYWIKIGMILYNTDENLFELWNKWSSKSNKYKENEMKKKWNDLKKSKNKYSLGTLIKWTKDENIIIENSIENIIKEYPEDKINLDISNFNNTIIDLPKLTPEIYKKIIHNKLICIQSEKGTGKTTNLFETILKDNKNTSILFISSRVTFGLKLLGDLKKYGFELYSQCNNYYINSKRIICQIDSLLRLDYDNYEIIIIDECESLSRYLTSSYFSKNIKSNLIISSLNSILLEANQIYLMDADLSNRSINYYTNILKEKNIQKNEIHILVNNYRPAKDYTLVSCNISTWIRRIYLYLEKNKKLAIVMASNNKAKNIKEEILKKFSHVKILLINVEMDQNEKERFLINVNESWSKYDVIIYTPSVNMGVSFDIENYIDNIFCYGCNNSITSQELFQMIHRVRSPKDKNIYVTMDNYKSYNNENDEFSYDLIEKMVTQNNYLTENNIHTNVIQRNILKKNIIYPYRHEPIYDLYIRNCKEIIENRANFTKSFYGYAKFKKYNLNFLNKISEEDKEIEKEYKSSAKEKKIEEKKLIIDNIIKAELISKEKLIELNNKKNITNEEFYEIEKYNIIKCYNINSDNCTNDFLNKYYDKTKMKNFKNITTILNIDDQTTNIKLEILRKYNEKNKNCFEKLTQTNLYLYHKYIIDILENLGFDINKRFIPSNNIIEENNIDNNLKENKKISKKYNKEISKLENNVEDNDEFYNKIIDLNNWMKDNKADILFKYNVLINDNIINDKNKIKNKIILNINKIIKNFYGFSIKKFNKYYKLCDNDDLIELYPSNIKKLEYKNVHINSSNMNINKLDEIFDD